jgi:hypothetical protein
MVVHLQPCFLLLAASSVPMSAYIGFVHQMVIEGTPSSNFLPQGFRVPSRGTFPRLGRLSYPRPPQTQALFFALCAFISHYLCRSASCTQPVSGFPPFSALTSSTQYKMMMKMNVQASLSTKAVAIPRSGGRSPAAAVSGACNECVCCC